MKRTIIYTRKETDRTQLADKLCQRPMLTDEKRCREEANSIS